jgi:hypothetical protein
MNMLAITPSESLPTLIDRASAALASARTSAEVLEARDLARVAYDAAKSAGRMFKVKQAHASLIADVHRAQAHALAIRARAEMRLAEEYDDAQDRGEVATIGQRSNVAAPNVSTAAELGLRRDEIHEARKIRDAERADPGIIHRAIEGMIERGEEPTRAALRKEITAKPKPQMAREPLWVWGRVKDFDRDGILAISPMILAAGMTGEMRQDMRNQLPAVIAYLTKLEQIV